MPVGNHDRAGGGITDQIEIEGEMHGFDLHRIKPALFQKARNLPAHVFRPIVQHRHWYWTSQSAQNFTDGIARPLGQHNGALKTSLGGRGRRVGVRFIPHADKGNRGSLR